MTGLRMLGLGLMFGTGLVVAATFGCGGSTPTGRTDCVPGRDAFCTPPGFPTDGGDVVDGGDNVWGDGGLVTTPADGGGPVTPPPPALDGGLRPGRDGGITPPHDGGTTPHRDGGAMPVDAGPGHDSCDTVYSCFRSCSSDSCRQRCITRGTTEAQNEFAAINSCQLPAGCEDIVCRLGSCPDAVSACFDVQDNAGTATCSEVSDCDDTCGNDPACRVRCFFDGTSEARTDYFTAYKCYVENNCQSFRCFQQNCPNEVRKCYAIAPPDGGPVITPDAGSLSLSCNQVLQCWQQCFDYQCTQDCLLSASASGWTYVSPMLACSNRNNCFRANGGWSACMQTNCATELANCQNN